MSNAFPFYTERKDNQIILKKRYSLTFTHKGYYKLFNYIRAGLRIGATAITKEKLLKGTEEEIIKQIHRIRYNAGNPYIITGGHFYQIFVRNLGVFFNALLDPRIPSTDEDWYLRQSIALKTIAYDLEIFQLAGREFTTITPITKSRYTALNLYARPSDSLHAIVYTLMALTDDTFIENRFPMKRVPKHPLQSHKAAKELLLLYTPLLKRLLKTYYVEVIDSKTTLIKKDLLLASARDGIKRQSAFYDNVILWATIQVAAKLKLYDISERALLVWKKKIITTFWDENTGIFLDDLSQYAQRRKNFSADSFVVTSTGFLDVKKTTERKMLTRMVEYVKKHNLDKPFPLHYSSVDLPNKLYLPVRYFAPTYMGTSIWCHWGMEYIKALIYLAKYDNGLLHDAKKHLESYKANIELYGGYPETYDAHGKLLKTRLYRSVLHNGWIINYEQTKMLFGHKVT